VLQHAIERCARARCVDDAVERLRGLNEAGLVDANQEAGGEKSQRQADRRPGHFE